MNITVHAPPAPSAALDSFLTESASATVADTVLFWGERRPERLAIRFLRQGGKPDEITFAALAARIRACGAGIAGLTAPGDRVLLVFPPGLDFSVAFLGCQWAGTVPVPTMPLRPADDGEKLRALAADCGAAMILTAEAAPFNRLDLGMPVIEIGDLAGEGGARRTELAFLQYTSGSTGRPKGVMVTHDNLLANLKMIARRFGATDEATCVSWLPAYHDMGLIGTLLMPLAVGLSTTLMSPTAFLRDPLSWLRAISQYRADVSGGPNFAFELCVRRLNASQPGSETLDLSSWRLAFTGAEPVRARTLSAFAAAAAPYGFRPDALQPCYGLAECTLYASAAKGHPGYLSKRFDIAALSRGSAVPADNESKDAVDLVLSGDLSWTEEGTIRIIDPATASPVTQDHVGEIWIAGPHVAEGYWRRPQETSETFGNTLIDDDQRYLRTRDLGFVHGGQLYVVGRRDDVIISNGLNFFPEDIEQTVSATRPALSLARAAVFDIGHNGETAIVAVQEISREGRAGLDVEGIKASIRSVVFLRHGIGLKDVVLVRPFAVPLTSSGKVRRRACRDAYLSGSLDIFTPLVSDGTPPAPPPAPAKRLHPIAALVAEVKHCPADTIDVSLPASALGLDSLQLIQLQMLLETQLGWVVSTETLLAERPISELGPESGTPRPAGTYWADASLPSELRPRPGTPGTGHILITGATGVVGGQLIRDLLQNASAPICCLVRAESDDAALRRLLSSLGLNAGEGRLSAIAADLTRPRFGLSQDRFDAIAADVGTVIHCAAELDFLKPYEALRPSNVDAVRELLALGAIGRPKHYIYLSSISVIETPAHAGRRLTEETPLDFPDSLAVGYAQSKWVGEKMMWAAADRGFAVDILRPGWIVEGAEFLDRFIAACHFLGAVPDGGHSWNFVSLATVIAAVRLSMRDLPTLGKLRLRNLGASRPVPSRHFASALRRHGVEARILPIAQWCGEMLGRAAEPANPLAPFTPLFRDGGALATPAHAYLSGALPMMDSRRTRRWLSRAGVPTEPVDLDAVVAAALKTSAVP